MNLNEWYNNKIHIPTKFGVSMQNFAASSIGLVKRALGDEGAKIEIRIEDTDSPYVDGTKIVFTKSMFSNDPDERPNPIATVDETISACLGVVVHEAGHIKYSAPTLPDYLKIAGAEENHNLIKTFFNILEDIYLEAQMINNEYWSAWMIRSAWHYFLPESRLEEIVPVYGPATTLDEAGDLIRVAILIKNRDLDLTGEFGDFIDTFIADCFNIENFHDQTERYVEAYRLYKLYFDVEDECKEQEEKMQQMLSELLDLLSMLQMIEKDFHESDWDEEALEFKRVERDTYDGLISEFSGEDIPWVELSINATSGTGYFEPDTRYYKLSSLAKQLSSKAMPKGIRSKRGNRIVSPRNIVLDQKIFRKKIDAPKNRPLEIILLVDLSGSMSFDRNYIKALSSGFGCAYGAVSGGHSVAIYGHTADTGTHSSIGLTMYRFKSFEDKLSTAKGRMNTFISERFSMAQNRDGEAIRFCTKKFRQNNNRKALVVISDGAPEAIGYHGREARMDTAVAVNSARRLGIEVVSISITSSAVIANNFIYGERHNVCNDDPTVAVDTIKRLMSK